MRPFAAGAALVVWSLGPAERPQGRGPAPPPGVPALTISRETTYVLEPLRADGTPDYVAWLDRRHGADVTPDTNAAIPLLRVFGAELDADVWRAMGAGPAPLSGVRWVPGGPGGWGEQWTKARRAPWKEADAPLIAAWLRANQAALSEIETATLRPRFWIPVPREFSFQSRPPSLLGFRQAANALHARTLLALARGDLQAARRDVVTGLRLAGRVGQDAGLVTRLVAVALRGQSAAVVPLLARAAGRDPAEARALVADLRRVPAVGSPGELSEVERVRTLQELVHFYRAGRKSPHAWRRSWSEAVAVARETHGQLGIRPPSTEAFERIPPSAIDWDDALRTLNRWWDVQDAEAVAAAAKDLERAALGPLLAAAANDAGARRRIGRAFLVLVQRLGLDDDPPYHRWRSGAQAAGNQNEAEFRVGLVSAAAAAWRAERGRYPATGADLALGPSSPGFDPDADQTGYAFRYLANSAGTRFAYSAQPQEPGETGVRGFCADSTGRLASTDHGGAIAVVDATCDPRAETLVSEVPVKED
jgi:hypothetical protein